jgi:hypothetical protein
MWWQFWKREPNVSSLPEGLSRHLGWRYSLDQEILERLRCASLMSGFGAKKTTFFRVFDPALLSKEAPVVRRYNDLDAHRSAIQFEGRLYHGRFQDFVDFRPAA